MNALPASSSTATAAPGPVLRDIHLPPDPSWWLPAPGWWMLAGLLLLIALLAAWQWRRHAARVQKRARVLAELDELMYQYQSDGNQSALASGMHQLLRRVARRHDALAAKKRGEVWRQTLARVSVDAATLDRLMTLEQVIYRTPASFDHAAASAAVRQWLQLALRPAKWKRVATSLPADSGVRS